MNIRKTSLFLSGLLLSSLSIAHEGHDHHGLSSAETQQQAMDGKLCILKKQGYSLGAIVEHNGKIFRCVKAWDEDMQEQKTLVWIELILKDKTLITAP
ncbi:DUF1496 domain-containing protein [Cellvibrio sp. PSBB023]|uniref:DUF1496 domain-containing protein n=1 Tax=Cellvibrio sp. PSBB023 TaxID=1945512 RepID=UPI00098F44AF|nr:DUF1496 domain-containing protein [Cellvibrio sp. PSBB023]AQT61331.1 hypothetical protein B0D95_15340 [Cellvibrio sp. PSBB023]